MSYFNFLVPDLQDDDTPDPESTQVRRKGKDYWENDPTTPAGPEDEIRLRDTTRKATAEEMKPYAQRRGETSSQVFASADKVIDKYSSQNPDLAEAAKREVRANPDDAAKAVEKYLTNVVGRQNDAAGVPMGKPDISHLYDQDFSSLENNVRALRSMKRGPDEKALSGQLAQTDLSKNLSTIESLRGQLDTLTKGMAAENLPEAVSRRGEEENKKALGAKQEQAAALAAHIKELENQTGGQQPEPQAAPAAPVEVKNAPTALPNSPQPVTDYFDALGIDKKKLVQSMHDAFEAGGITPDKWDQIVPTHAGLLRTLSFLDRNGTFANALAYELSQAKAKDQQDREQGQQTQPQQPGAKGQQQPQQQDRASQFYADEQKRLGGEIQTLEDRSGQREARMRELYAKLNEAPFMQTWPGIILYVLTGMLVGPGIATKIFGNLDNRRAIGNELDNLKFQLRRLDGQIEARQKEMNYSRHMALQRMTHKDDEAEKYDRDIQKMFLQNKLILERQKAAHPEQKGAYDQLGKAFVRERGFMRDAQHRKDEAQRILSNDFSDEKDKVKARSDMAIAEQEIQQHKANLQALDGTIKKMGGIQLEQEGNETEQ